MIVTVEIVARIEFPDDVEVGLTLVDYNKLEVPLVRAPLFPNDPASRHFAADLLTVQYRLTEGNFYLPDAPTARSFG